MSHYPKSGSTDPRNASLVAFAHFAVAVIYTLVLGIDIAADPLRNTWDWFWQSVPVDLLQTHMLQSIWSLHSQPPVYNLLMGILVKLFFPNHLYALQGVNIVLGSVLSGMLYYVIVRLVPRRPVAFGLALVLAMNPALFLYEAYILYTLLCAFLIVLNVFCLGWHGRTRSTLALSCFVLSLTVLILTRSLYHIALLAPGIGLVLLVADPVQRKRVLVVCIISCLVVAGWCFKNYLQFGFFGTSSWYGIGLYKIASASCSPDEVRRMVDEGRLGRMVIERGVFEKPSKFRPYGFTKTSSIGVLSRDSIGNINIPDISRVYAKNASRLIARYPNRYFQSVYAGYAIFCRPSSQFKHLPLNAAKIRYHEAVYSSWLQGTVFSTHGLKQYGSILFFVLPASLFLYALQCVIRLRRSASWRILLRDDAIMLWSFVLIAYTLIVSCMAEFGEQDRFKFNVEQIMWVFIVVVFARCIARHESFIPCLH